MGEPVKDFQTEVDAAFSTAFKSTKGGDETWNALMATYLIKPLSDGEKEALLNSSMKINAGAFPIELRRVLQAIVRKHASLTVQLPIMQDLLRNYNLDAEVIRYYNRIKPFSGMSDIFKNAKSTTKNYSEGIGAAKKSAIRCKNCGAPRLEEMQYDECMFCGSELFEPNN
jgi:hypothetical protein